MNHEDVAELCALGFERVNLSISLYHEDKTRYDAGVSIHVKTLNATEPHRMMHYLLDKLLRAALAQTLIQAPEVEAF